MSDDFVPVTVKLKRPPEGMEWQIREPVPQREYYAGKMVNIEAVLRPIVPVTVNLPEGYELADTKMRPSHAGEWYLDNSIGGARRRVGEEHPNAMRVILRPIVSATVMVERDVLERLVDRIEVIQGCSSSLTAHARAALARKPCPVMVCNNGGHFGECVPFLHRADEQPDRRPCKLTEGHGGEHE